MKPKDPKVIEILNDVLSAELTAINQYFAHSEMCKNWGYDRLFKILRERSMEEMRDAQELIRRILYFEGVPNVQRLYRIAIGENVPEQLKADLALERDAVERLNKHIATLTDLGDNATADQFVEMLHDEERHVNFQEAQLNLIAQMGVENYLAQQIGEAEDGK
ncbi:MAG: bacterioferritin [Candidatus Eiseniibacteriota bacterium]